MTTNTTNPSKERMDCARVAREEVLEGYLLGRLPDEDREAFEEHYFECSRCFDELQTLRTARAELARMRVEPESSTRFFFGWRAACVAIPAIILVVGLALWRRAPAAPPPETTTAKTSPQVLPERVEARTPETTGGSEPTLEQLAELDPPPYEPSTLRGPLDEATQRFRRGMENYRNAKYTSAVDNLLGARTLDPGAAHISFFLGVSQLMAGQDDAAVESLRATIALGDSPYLEEAHFYLAKAFLRRKDLRGAERELNQVIHLGGIRKGAEASRLLVEIERIKQQ